ncbi:MAG TPA: YceI family protein [Acidimicrobiales bacterium]|jgi:polyisoprenoid-binding protein YceI|nr:YceI family protein [Acidimicrobiales bacterium]
MAQPALSVLRTYDRREIPAAGSYAIDPSHTSVEFVGRHLMITKVRGRFPDVSGTIIIDDDPARSHVEVVMDVATLDTGNTDRDNHLRGADFFEADRYPTITFRSTKVEEGRSGTWNVTGDLTVRDVTRPVTLEVDFDGASASPFGDERIAFSAATEVDREDWGLTWNVALETGGVLVGKKVRIELNVQAVAGPGVSDQV